LKGCRNNHGRWGKLQRTAARNYRTVQAVTEAGFVGSPSAGCRANKVRFLKPDLEGPELFEGQRQAIIIVQVETSVD
jgi:hypothetical protein